MNIVSQLLCIFALSQLNCGRHSRKRIAEAHISMCREIKCKTYDANKYLLPSDMDLWKIQ